jgi:hypothetical protein
VATSLLQRYVLAISFCLLTAVGLRAQSAPSVLSNDQQQARDVLNQSVEAFKNAQFAEAVPLFTRAKQLDLYLENASLYLARAYASQYVPGAPSDENIQKGNIAAQEYRDVLEKNPSSLSAIDGLASILYQMAGQPFRADLFEESKSCHKRQIELKPQDPQPYYSVGVIDWALAYRGNTELRGEFNRSVGIHPRGSAATKNEEQNNVEVVGLKDADPLPEVIRRKYADEFGPTIDEGIASLRQAIQLKPNYDDAMTYLSLLYRRKADTVAEASEREQDIEMADDLLDRVKEIKMQKAGGPPAN